MQEVTSKGKQGHVDVLNLLIKQGAKLDREVSPSGATPYLIACQQGNVQCVKRILEAGCNRDKKTTGGCDALIISAMQGHLKLISLLLDYGMDLNSKTEENETPLYVACQNGHALVAQLLLFRGAEGSIVAKSTNMNAFEIAVHMEHDHIVEMFNEHTRKITQPVIEYTARSSV